TRSDRDRSSDVCSSDLVVLRVDADRHVRVVCGEVRRAYFAVGRVANCESGDIAGVRELDLAAGLLVEGNRQARVLTTGLRMKLEIGRASCRERDEGGGW